MKDTLYDLIRQIHEPTVLSGSVHRERYRERYLFYWAYYLFWTLLGLRLLSGSFALRSGLFAYFDYDMTVNILRELSSSSPDFLLVFGLITPFPVFAHSTVYYTPDWLIWEHMYDVLVRNVDQFKAENGQLLFNLSLGEILTNELKLFLKFEKILLHRLSGRNIEIRQKLRYFPHVPAKVRSQILFLGWTFEIQVHALYLGKYKKKAF